MTQRLTTERLARRLEESDGALAAVRSWPSGKARLWTIDAVAVARQDSAILAIVASGIGRAGRCARAMTLTWCWSTAGVRRISRGRRSAWIFSSTKRPRCRRSWRTGTISSRGRCASADRYSNAISGGPACEPTGTTGCALPSAAEARKRARRARQLHQEMQSLGDHDAATENYVSMLTHLARATLSDAGILPRSRPELADQLRQIGETPLADRLTDALTHRYS